MALYLEEDFKSLASNEWSRCFGLEEVCLEYGSVYVVYYERRVGVAHRHTNDCLLIGSTSDENS